MLLHRVGAPVFHSDKLRAYWVNGGVHRVDGPARTLLCTCMSEDYFLHGTQHRVDGPANVFSGYGSWFVEGVRHLRDRPWQRRCRRLRWLLPPGVPHTFVNGPAWTSFGSTASVGPP